MVKSTTDSLLEAEDPWNSSNFSHPHSLLGAVSWLMAHAPYHSQWNLFDFEREIAPPIALKQYRLYHTDQGEPTGFVSWAFISSDVKQALITRARPMQLDDWKSGEIVLIYDLIAPFGHCTHIVNDLRSHQFANDESISIRRNLDGSVRKINQWVGRNRAAETRLRKADAPLCLPHLGIPPKTHAKA